MRGSAALRTGVTPGGALAGPWVRDPLWTRARAVPSLDLRFADSKSLVDATTGQSLVTFTRASSGTFVGSDGVLRTAVTNLLLRSEEFGDTFWTKTNATITPDNIASPTGSVAADKLVETSATGVHRAFNNTVAILANTTYTVSVYAKAGERSRLQLDLRDSLGVISAATFNLADGTFISNTGTAHTITPLQNGWYRLAISATTAVSHATAGTYVFAMSDGTSMSYTGDGTSGLFLWGAQLEQSATVGEYIPTTSTINSAPRFDHNPTTGESLGLLVEEQRTNSITNNTMVGAVAGTPGTNPTSWSFVSSPGGITKEIIGVGTESGINYIDFRFFGTTTNANGINIAPGTGAALTGQTWNASTYWKLTGGSTDGVSSFTLGLIEQTSGGGFVTGAFYGQTAPTSASLISQRPTATRTLTGGATVAQVRHTVQANIPTSTAIDITLRIGLPQLEQGAFATSVIPTTTAAATRSADVCSITGTAFSSWYRQDEGTVFAETQIGRQNAVPGAAMCGIETGVNNAEAIYMHYRGGGSTAFFMFDNSVSQVDQSPYGAVVAANTVVRQAAAVKLNDSTSAGGGSVLATDTACTLPTPDRLLIGFSTAGLAYLSGHIRRLTYWGQRLPNNVLQQITQ